MDHAGAQDLEPAGVFAELASSAAAEDALHVHLCTWFCEGEVVGAKADVARCTEHLSGKVGEGAFEVGQADISSDGEEYPVDNQIEHVGFRLVRDP